MLIPIPGPGPRAGPQRLLPRAMVVTALVHRVMMVAPTEQVMVVALAERAMTAVPTERVMMVALTERAMVVAPAERAMVGWAPAL